MKKVVSILAVVVFALGLFATQIERTIDFDFGIENALTCIICGGNHFASNDGGTIS